MLSKNVERWIEEWKAEGEAKGHVEGRRSVARKLLATGMPVSKICEITDLSEEEISALSDITSH